MQGGYGGQNPLGRSQMPQGRGIGSGMGLGSSGGGFQPATFKSMSVDGLDLWGNPIQQQGMGGLGRGGLNLGNRSTNPTQVQTPPMMNDAGGFDGFGGQTPPPSIYRPPYVGPGPHPISPADPNGPQYGSPLNSQNPYWDRFAGMIANPATRAQGLAMYRQALDSQRMPIGSESGGGEYAPINLTRR